MYAINAPLHALPSVRRYAPRFANHHLDSARWAVMGATYTVSCGICHHEHSPEYSRDLSVCGKQVRICPECIQALRTGDVLTLIDLIYDERYDD